MIQITKNFNLLEFQSKDGSKMPYKVEKEVKETARNLQKLRDYLGVPLHINSAYRSPNHNRNIGGVKNSTHLKGIAVDLSSKHITPYKLYKTIEYLINKGVLQEGGLGLYNGFVHYDRRGYKARWSKVKWYRKY